MDRPEGSRTRIWRSQRLYLQWLPAPYAIIFWTPWVWHLRSPKSQLNRAPHGDLLWGLIGDLPVTALGILFYFNCSITIGNYSRIICLIRGQRGLRLLSQLISQATICRFLLSRPIWGLTVHGCNPGPCFRLQYRSLHVPYGICRQPAGKMVLVVEGTGLETPT